MFFVAERNVIRFVVIYPAIW